MQNELEQFINPDEKYIPEFDYSPLSKTWWEDIITDEERLLRWLCRLHNTEKEAEHRFNEFADTYCQPDTRESKIFQTIAAQEKTHGELIEDVLNVRGVTIDHDAEYAARYWAHVDRCIVDKETAAGVGFFAEDLSLQRMQVIIDHPDTPSDLRDMFVVIHRDEGYHTRILAKLAGDYGITQVVDCHTEGLIELGLSIAEVKRKPV